MDKEPNKIHKNLIHVKIKQPYHTTLTLYITINNTNIPYNWPAGS